MNAPVLNATVPESGIVKDASGNILLKYYSHQQLIRWFVQEGLGDMEDFQKRGFKIEPMSPYGREARNERAAEGVKRFGSLENRLFKVYAHNDEQNIVAIEAETPKEAKDKAWAGDQMRDYLKLHPDTSFQDLKVR